jgi:RNA polymerase sigma-70 factor (ECF subfamily)
MLTLESIYQEHYAKVFALCYRILKNQEEAEDLAQDTFIRVGKNLHQFRGDAKLSTWLHRVTVNEVLMYLRRQKRNKERSVSINEEGVNLLVENAEAESVFFPEQIDVEKAVAQLPPGYREAWLLQSYMGYEHHEVGEIMGIHVGTVKSQCFKARQKLKKLLNKQANPRVRVVEAERQIVRETGCPLCRIARRFGAVKYCRCQA